MTAVADARLFDVTLPDGRTLRGYETGDAEGRLVVFHHGTPGAGIIPEAWVEDALVRGIRVVGFDRAGYGGSDRHEGRQVKDAAADTAALVDHLGVDRFYTWGVSGGGPHALACAALLGDRVIAAAVLASAAPAVVDDLDFLAGMGEDNVAEFGAAITAAQAPNDPSTTAGLHDFLDQGRKEMEGSTPEQLRDVLQTLLPEVD